MAETLNPTPAEASPGITTDLIEGLTDPMEIASAAIP